MNSPPPPKPHNPNNSTSEKAALPRGFFHQNARKIRDPNLAKNLGPPTAKSVIQNSQKMWAMGREKKGPPNLDDAA
jgi:hypothetical protein